MYILQNISFMVFLKQSQLDLHHIFIQWILPAPVHHQWNHYVLPPKTSTINNLVLEHYISVHQFTLYQLYYNYILRVCRQLTSSKFISSNDFALTYKQPWPAREATSCPFQQNVKDTFSFFQSLHSRNSGGELKLQ